MTLTLFAYPWDIAEVGAARFVDEIAELGVDTVAVATVYHSAEVINPRRNALITAEPGVAHLPLGADHFDGVAPPVGSLATGNPQLFDELRTSTREAGIRMLGWTVALHQTTMASIHPELAPRTCGGDVMTHGLCPAQPRVRRYVTDLVDALGATEWFDLLLLESIAYIPIGHGHPHELWAARFDPITRALMSLCFCEACVGVAGESGVDAEGVRRWVADELDRGWNGPLAQVRDDDDGTEALGVLLGNADLLGYVNARLDIVADLAAEAVEHAHAADLAAWLSSPVWARPLWTSWMQGVDPARIGRFADGYGLQAYYAEAGLVAREIDHARRFVPAEKLVLMQTMMRDHHRSSAELLAKLAIGRAAGICEFTLYNYGMIPTPQMAWISEAASAVRPAASQFSR